MSVDRKVRWEDSCQPTGDGTIAWWKDAVARGKVEMEPPLEYMTNRPDPPHTEYWKEVSRREFEEELLSMFSALTSKECTGHWHPTRNRPCAPEVRLGDNHLVIHQESAIYDDFKIDWGTGQSRYYLHNYCFWV